MRKNMLVESFEIPEQNEQATKNALMEIRSDAREQTSAEYVPKHTWYYVSDLHLMHRIQKLVWKSKKNIERLIDKIVEDLLPRHPEYLLFGGDICSDYIVFEYFVRRVGEEIKNRSYRAEVYFVLGNHDLWSFPGKSFQEIVEIYKKLLDECGMHLIQNELVYFERTDMGTFSKCISINELLSEDIAALRDKTRKATMLLLGGTAFSGKNESFNANNGIYRGVLSREQEIEESKKFNELYERVREAFCGKRLIVFTHTPVGDWASMDEYQPGFIYVNGHDHKNRYFDDGETRIYADNQIGYANNIFQMKYFRLNNEYEMFVDYEDGIYQISADDFVAFYRGMNRMVNLKRKHKQIYMLKKNGYYCFVMENANSELFIMNGGQIKRLDHKNIEYYYKHMDAVISRLTGPVEKFNKILRLVSDEVKSFGGDGRIHGCIVDISFFEHIYVFPGDLSLTAYYAESIVDKWVYPSVPALLQAKCPKMFEEYQKRLAEDSNNLPVVSRFAETGLSIPPVKITETEMYGISKELLKMQRLSSKILCTWNEGTGSYLGIETDDY